MTASSQGGHQMLGAAMQRLVKKMELAPVAAGIEGILLNGSEHEPKK